MATVEERAPAIVGHSFFGPVSRVFRLAMPLMMGSLAAAGLQIAKAGVLSYHGDEAALFELSQVQPAFIFMLAFLESLAIANQVLSSKSVSGWPRGDLVRSSRVYSAIGLILTILLAGTCYGAYVLLADSLPTAASIMPKAAIFMLSLAPFMLFEIRNAGLRGQGKATLALVPFVVLILVDLAITYVAISRFELGFYAIILGNALAPLLALPLASFLLRRVIGNAETSDPATFRKHIIGMLIGVAFPVFASTFVGSASAAVIFPILSGLGESTSSAFLFVVRLRILFLLPAVAVGSAIAILVNSLPAGSRKAEKRRILICGVISVSTIYAAATIILSKTTPFLVGFVTPYSSNASLNITTLHLTSVLLISFFFISVSTMIQVILEHLGRGAPVFILIFLLEVTSIILMLLTADQPDRLDAIVRIMNGMAMAMFVVISLVFVGLLQKVGENNAV